MYFCSFVAMRTLYPYGSFISILCCFMQMLYANYILFNFTHYFYCNLFLDMSIIIV